MTKIRLHLSPIVDHASSLFGRYVFVGEGPVELFFTNPNAPLTRRVVRTFETTDDALAEAFGWGAVVCEGAASGCNCRPTERSN